MENRPPQPPFTLETAMEKVQLAENGWNTKDPAKVASAYTIDCQWRNRAEIFSGREMIIEFLTRKWEKELNYRLKKELWCFADNRIAVTFRYEWHDDSGQWYRSYGNELWEFAENGLMQQRIASINDKPIIASERVVINPNLEIIMNQVKILTSPSCSYCHAAKDLLQREGIAYQEVEAFKDSEQAQQLLTQSGQRTFPQIFINEKPIGGFTELSKLVRDSEFNLPHFKSLN